MALKALELKSGIEAKAEFRIMYAKCRFLRRSEDLPSLNLLAVGAQHSIF